MSKQKFDYSFLHLLGLEGQFTATKDAVVHLDTFWIVLDRICLVKFEQKGKPNERSNSASKMGMNELLSFWTAWL